MQRCRGRLSGRAHHHAEQDLILDAVVRRNADRRRLTDAGMLDRDRLDLRRSDGLASPADRLAEAAVEGQQAVLVPSEQVARPVPPVLGGILRLRSGADVALEDDVRRGGPDPGD